MTPRVRQAKRRLLARLRKLRDDYDNGPAYFLHAITQLETELENDNATVSNGSQASREASRRNPEERKEVFDSDGYKVRPEEETHAQEESAAPIEFGEEISEAPDAAGV